jgi:hypothetical protein
MQNGLLFWHQRRSKTETIGEQGDEENGRAIEGLSSWRLHNWELHNLWTSWRQTRPFVKEGNTATFRQKIISGHKSWTITEVSSFCRTQHSRCLLPLTWRLKQTQFPKRCILLVLELQTMDKVQNPVILIVVLHRQNPSDSSSPHFWTATLVWISRNNVQDKEEQMADASLC